MNTVPYPEPKRGRRRVTRHPERDVTCYPGSNRVKVIVALDPKVIAHLERLLATGLYGVTIDATVERLLCEQLRRVLREG